MMKYINYTLVVFLLPVTMIAQQTPTLSLDTILARIESRNLQLQTYSLRAQSYRHLAEASTGWMAPMAGIGTFMTPYPGQTLMDDRDKGMIMLQAEQSIPNPSKQRAKKRYIESQADVELASLPVAYNELRAQAKSSYYNWLIAERRLKLLKQNESILQTMKKIEEVRYPYNQSNLGNVYKMDARIEENRNMVKMEEGNILSARALLSGLMNSPGDTSYSIDTLFQPNLDLAPIADTTALAFVRKDVGRMDQSIRNMQLNIASMQTEKKPEFRIRFDHMNPLGAMMPKAFSVMGMVTIPIAPWSSRMYKSEIKAMEYNVLAMEKERSAMLQETQGMLYGMTNEIHAMQKKIDGIEQKIIPALQKAMDVNFLTYQENKLSLTELVNTWEGLTMMKMELLNDKLRLFQMYTEYEKQLYR